MIGENAPRGLSKEEAKTLVKRATLAVFEHYAGAPRAVPPPDRRPWGRYSFDCPGCGSPKGLKMTVFDDGRPPGYGRGGCPADPCPVPKNGDVFDLVRAMLGRGKKTRPSFDEILAAALAIARRASSGGAGVGPSAPGAAEPDEPSGPFVSGSLSLPPDPATGQHSGATHGAKDALFGLLPGERPEVQGGVPAGKPGGGKDRRRASPRPQTTALPPAQPQPDLLFVVSETCPDPADADLKAGLEADLAARARVYEGLLRLCPPDGRLVEDLKTLGISEGLVRREGFGAFYPARAAGVMASLQLELGAGALPAAPGFEQPAGGSPPRFELEGGGEQALYGLVPYRDARGRVIALEAIDLSRPETFGGHRLVGGGKDGRDDALGGAHHVWYPGDPAFLQAVTDDLLEGLRAASTGVRCAAIRGPQSFSPGAGRETLPGLEGVSLAGRRVLYAPGHSSRAREAAPAAARALIASCGGRALVSKQVIEGKKKGLGSYLLGHAPDERLRAFALLCSEANVAVLPAEAASPSPEAGGSPNRSEKGSPPRPRAGAEGVGKAPREQGGGEAPGAEPFYVEARKRPAGPSRRRGPLWAERLWGAAAGGFVFVAAWAPLAALLGLCGDLIGAFAGAVSEAAVSMEAGGHIPLGKPFDWPAWLLARLLGPWAEGSAQAVTSAAGEATLGMVPALFGGLVAVPAGLFVTAARHRHRRKRIKLVEGRLKQW